MQARARSRPSLLAMLQEGGGAELRALLVWRQKDGLES